MHAGRATTTVAADAGATRWVRGLAWVMVALVSCAAPETAGAPPHTATESPTAGGRYDGEWRLTSGRGPAGKIRTPKEATLVLAGRRISGQTACNGYDGNVQIDGARFDVLRLGRTEMACPKPRAVAEERFIAALEAATAIARDGDTLHLTGDDVDLRFTAVRPPEAATFTDTTWRLESLAFGSHPDSTVTSTAAPAEVTFAADGTLTATTGCRDITGRWERDGDSVSVTGLPNNDVDCAVAGDQDDHIMTVLRSPFTAKAEGRALWLQQVDGDLGLDYRAD